MNALAIGMGSALAMEPERVIGDAQERQVQYSKYLSHFFIVVNSKRGMKLKVRQLSDRVIVYPTNSRNMLFFVWDAYRICKKIYQETPIDVVTTQDPGLTGLVGYLLKRRFGIPLCVGLFGESLDNKYWLREKKRNYFWNALSKFILKRADSIRVVSDQIETNVRELGISAERIINLPVFIDPTRFLNSESKINIKRKYPQFENVVLFVGVLMKTKNVDALLSAATQVIAKYPKTLFLIVGDGPEKERLMAFAGKLELEKNVRFEGKATNEAISSYYQACDLLVLPSWHEGWPRVVIESLACAKPVIISDTCGSANTVASGEYGLIFPPDSPDILAEKIVHLIENPELGRKMGEVGKEYVLRTQDIERNAYKYRELCETTIRLAKGR